MCREMFSRVFLRDEASFSVPTSLLWCSCRIEHKTRHPKLLLWCARQKSLMFQSHFEKASLSRHTKYLRNSLSTTYKIR